MNGLQYAKPDEEEELLNTLTPGTSTQAAPIQAPPPTMAPPPMGPTPTPQGAPPSLPPQAPPPQLPGMPPGIGGQDIQSYLSKQRQQMNQFGPDQRMALQDSLNERRNSFGYKAKEGLKGFADAIMMGVARAGNPGWQQQFAASENQNAQDQIGAFKDARTANLENVQGNMTLDQMDPNSELSKTKQESYAPLFEKLGYPPGKLQGMSAANIDSTLALMAQFGGMEIQSQIKEYELEIERAKMAQMSGKQAVDQELANQKLKSDAAGEVLKRAKNARVLGVPIPFTSDVSGDEEKAAQKVLLDQMRSGSSGGTEVDFQKHYDSLPSGSPYVGPDGKTRIKK